MTDRTPRKQPRQERSKLTVAAILEAAARILVEEGYAKANTNRIAALAGVSIGSLYEFFPNKDAIFTELRRSLNARMLEEVADVIGEVLALPIHDAVHKAVQALIRMHSVNPALDTALQAEVPGHALADQDREIARRLHELGMEFVTRHRREVRRDNLSMAVFVAIQASESLTHEAAKKRPESLVNGELEEELTDLISRYLTEERYKTGGS